MDTQTETLLAKVSQVKNVAVDGEVIQKATRFLTYNERQTRRDELDQITKQSQQPGYVQGAITAEGRQALSKRKRQIEKDLQAGTALELTGQAKDALAKREVELADSIKAGMLTTEEMRRNPVGAVDRHRLWERRNKVKILEWKNIRRALNQDSDEKDLSNVEVLRPSMIPLNGAATFMAGAQIPGQFAMTPAAKANFNLVFPDSPKMDTPLKQAERREKKPPDPQLTANRIAGMARARAAKAEKKLLASAIAEAPAQEG